jgi:pyruvate/2-oxoglutarate dehydrogenase complex dihydrolipoamide dehydrogenase (E3) component
MPDRQRYEILVIGSGEAGKYLAWTMAKAGRRTAVIERELIGGSCPNIACLPSKNIIHSAKVAQLVRRATEFGIQTGPVQIDMPGVQRRKRDMVNDLIGIHLDRYRLSGAELILGHARMIAPKTVEVRLKDGNMQILEGDQVFLNVGTHAYIPDVPGLKQANPITHVEALDLGRLPEHMLVLGGGFVALELGQAMQRLGSRVTIVDRGNQLLKREDPDVSEEMTRLFRAEGIEILLETVLLSVERSCDREISIQIRNSQGERMMKASDILVAAGRVPNTQGLDLNKAGVELDDRGYVRVNEKLQTTAPGVWAMGDCAGSPHFTHIAFDDFRVVRDNLDGIDRSTRGRLVPYCVFTDPELARVGLNESEAKNLGIPYRLVKIPASAVLRTRTLSETQ